jgi:hypothetical protein
VLVTNLAITFLIGFSLLATLCVVLAALPWTLVLVLPLGVFFARTRASYQKSLVEIKRCACPHSVGRSLARSHARTHARTHSSTREQEGECAHVRVCVCACARVR